MQVTALVLSAGAWSFGAAEALANDAASTAGAAPVVYKCKQANGSVLYADYPCGGGVVDIKPDFADLRAVDRLQRATEAFDRAAAERRYAEQMAAIREAPYGQPPVAQPAQDSADGDAYVTYPVGYGYYAPAAIPRKRFDQRPHPEPHRVATHKHQVPAVIRRPAPG